VDNYSNFNLPDEKVIIKVIVKVSKGYIMNQSNMPWQGKNNQWKAAKPWVLIGLAAIIAVGGGYFGWNYFANKPTDTTTTKTVSDSSLDQPITPDPTTEPATTESTTAADTTKTDTTKTATPTPTITSSTTTPTTTQTTSTTAVAPKITTASTFDLNNNGKIDGVKIEFSSPMTQSATASNGFKVSGYTIKSWQWANQGSTLNFTLRENDTYDTDATPKITYDATVGNLKGTNNAVLTSTTIKTIDLANPIAISATAIDTNATTGIQTGDKVIITFSEPIKASPSITTANINKVLPLNNDHSWKDGAEAIGSVVVSLDNKTITVTLSATTSAPTVAIDDSIHIGEGIDSIEDLSANSANGTNDRIQITGSF